MSYFSDLALSTMVGEVSEDARLDAQDGLPVHFACAPTMPAPTMDGMVRRNDYATPGLLNGHQAKALWAAVATLRETGWNSVDVREVSPYSVTLETVRRRATCRACKRPMSKGSEAVCFGMLWTDHQRFPTTSFAHPEPCATFTEYR